MCRYKILPRVLRDVSQCDTVTKILGCDISFPVAVAPTAMNRMAHPDGEIAAAKGFYITSFTPIANNLMTTAAVSFYLS